MFIANSGRYEYRTQGCRYIHRFTRKLNSNADLEKECVAFLLMPAYHKGPRQDLVDILNNNGQVNGIDKYLTHCLHYPSSDPVLQNIKNNGLENNPDDKVKIIFAPSYLNGNDGIFNLSYYDLLIGFDLSSFHHITSPGVIPA